MCISGQCTLNLTLSVLCIVILLYYILYHIYIYYHDFSDYPSLLSFLGFSLFWFEKCLSDHEQITLTGPSRWESL